MARILTREEAVELGQLISMVEEVDFANGEGKVVVFDNAVLIMSQDEDNPERLQAQLVVSKYERIDARVDSGIDWESVMEDFLS